MKRTTALSLLIATGVFLGAMTALVVLDKPHDAQLVRLSGKA